MKKLLCTLIITVAVVASVQAKEENKPTLQEQEAKFVQTEQYYEGELQEYAVVAEQVAAIQKSRYFEVVTSADYVAYQAAIKKCRDTRESSDKEEDDADNDFAKCELKVLDASKIEVLKQLAATKRALAKNRAEQLKEEKAARTKAQVQRRPGMAAPKQTGWFGK